MREILFRGKRTDNGKWEEGYIYEHEPPLQCLVPENYVPDPSQWFIVKTGFADWNMPRQVEFIEVEQDTICQYTGRTDKNGKRVFEGDILQLFTIWADGTVEPDEALAIVQFWENDQCYVLTTLDGHHCDDFENYGKPEYYEVIGNIHDNPELMDGGAE